MEVFTEMDLPMLAAIITLIVLAAIAIGVGAVMYTVQGRQNKHKTEAASRAQGQGGQEQERPGKEVNSEVPAQTEPTLKPEDYMPALPGEVMRVLRDEISGSLIIEVDGQRYHRLADIRDGRVGRRVLWAIADLLRFAEEVPLEAVAKSAPPAKAVAVPSVLPTETVTAAPPPAPAPMPSTEMPSKEVSSKTEDEFLRRLSEEGRAEAKAARPARTGLFRRREAQPSPEPAQDRTFVDDIEDILQKFIKESVVPVDSSAHVHAGSDGMIEIEVGGQNYDSLDDVPDPIVRGLIKAAVEEWERR